MSQRRGRDAAAFVLLAVALTSLAVPGLAALAVAAPAPPGSVAGSGVVSPTVSQAADMPGSQEHSPDSNVPGAPVNGTMGWFHRCASGEGSWCKPAVQMGKQMIATLLVWLPCATIIITVIIVGLLCHHPTYRRMHHASTAGLANDELPPRLERVFMFLPRVALDCGGRRLRTFWHNEPLQAMLLHLMLQLSWFVLSVTMAVVYWTQSLDHGIDRLSPHNLGPGGAQSWVIWLMCNLLWIAVGVDAILRSITLRKHLANLELYIAPPSPSKMPAAQQPLPGASRKGVPGKRTATVAELVVLAQDQCGVAVYAGSAPGATFWARFCHSVKRLFTFSTSKRAALDRVEYSLLKDAVGKHKGSEWRAMLEVPNTQDCDEKVKVARAAQVKVARRERLLRRGGGFFFRHWHDWKRTGPVARDDALEGALHEAKHDYREKRSVAIEACAAAKGATKPAVAIFFTTPTAAASFRSAITADCRWIRATTTVAPHHFGHLANQCSYARNAVLKVVACAAVAAMVCVYLPNLVPRGLALWTSGTQSVMLDKGVNVLLCVILVASLGEFLVPGLTRLVLTLGRGGRSQPAAERGACTALHVYFAAPMLMMMLSHGAFLRLLSRVVVAFRGGAQARTLLRDLGGYALAMWGYFYCLLLLRLFAMVLGKALLPLVRGRDCICAAVGLGLGLPAAILTPLTLVFDLAALPGRLFGWTGRRRFGLTRRVWAEWRMEVADCVRSILEYLGWVTYADGLEEQKTLAVGEDIATVLVVQGMLARCYAVICPPVTWLAQAGQLGHAAVYRYFFSYHYSPSADAYSRWVPFTARMDLWSCATGVFFGLLGASYLGASVVQCVLLCAVPLPILIVSAYDTCRLARKADTLLSTTFTAQECPKLSSSSDFAAIARSYQAPAVRKAKQWAEEEAAEQGREAGLMAPLASRLAGVLSPLVRRDAEQGGEGAWGVHRLPLGAANRTPLGATNGRRGSPAVRRGGLFASE